MMLVPTGYSSLNIFTASKFNRSPNGIFSNKDLQELGS
jgi:hypothetical protein